MSPSLSTSPDAIAALPTDGSRNPETTLTLRNKAGKALALTSTNSFPTFRQMRNPRVVTARRSRRPSLS